MLSIYVRHVLVVEKVHEIISLTQSKRLEKSNSFDTQKRNRAKIDFWKDSFELLVNAAFGKILENVRNHLRLELIEKDGDKNILKQQSKLTFNAILESYENSDSYTFKEKRSSYG